MKKLFFSAMACTAFAGSAFASNEVATVATILNNNLEVISDGPIVPVRTYYCTVHVQLSDGKGGYYTRTFSETYYFVTKLQGDAKCNAFNNHIAQTYNLTPSDPFIVG